ncbi:MAG: DUF943 family protein [Alcaligenaceae bacterium]|nr:DUF943 family protein [Alcaligenaceae bacterium]
MTTPKHQPKSPTKKIGFRAFIFLLLLVAVSLSSYYLNKTFFNERQTNILGDATRLVSKASGADYIFLTNPPKTSQALIDWWIEHRQLLTDDYGIPKNERMQIFIWDATKGFRETDEHDFFSTANLSCFKAITSKENCLDFDYLIMNIETTHDGIFIFDSKHGEIYHQHPGEKIRKSMFDN